jgi:hypothetical protein
MGYRQLQGFAQSFLGKLLSTAVPNFRTICYRFKFEGELPDDAIIIVDSTGMKVTNRVEWIRMRGVMKRRGWVYEAKGKKIVEFKVTDERGQDCKEGLEMLKELCEKTKRSNKRIRKVIADAGYDTQEIFNYLSERCIEAVIKLRRNLSRIIRYMRDSGGNWSRELGYNKRWLIGSFFSSYKKFFGEHVNSIKKEIFFKLLIMNSFYSYNNLTN